MANIACLLCDNLVAGHDVFTECRKCYSSWHGITLCYS